MDPGDAKYNPEATVGPTDFTMNRESVWLTPLDTLILNEPGLNSVKITAVDGKTVYRASILGGSGKPLEISGLKQGIYFLSVRAGKDQKVRRVFVN